MPCLGFNTANIDCFEWYLFLVNFECNPLNLAS